LVLLPQMCSHVSSTALSPDANGDCFSFIHRLHINQRQPWFYLRRWWEKPMIACSLQR
jgi:hypothetical protein